MMLALGMPIRVGGAGRRRIAPLVDGDGRDEHEQDDRPDCRRVQSDKTEQAARQGRKVTPCRPTASHWPNRSRMRQNSPYDRCANQTKTVGEEQREKISTNNTRTAAKPKPDPYFFTNRELFL